MDEATYGSLSNFIQPMSPPLWVPASAGTTVVTGCVPRSLSGATDATDLSDAGLSICQ